jgi:hypothetical protein
VAQLPSEDEHRRHCHLFGHPAKIQWQRIWRMIGLPFAWAVVSSAMHWYLLADFTEVHLRSAQCHTVTLPAALASRGALKRVNAHQMSNREARGRTLLDVLTIRNASNWEAQP